MDFCNYYKTDEKVETDAGSWPSLPLWGFKPDLNKALHNFKVLYSLPRLTF